MSLDIGDLVGYIKLDHSGVGQGVRSAQAEMRQGMDRIAAEANRQGQKAGQEAGRGLSKGFKGATDGLRNQVVGVLAVSTAIAGLNNLKNAASDLNETTSMAGVIFGKNAKAMDAWAGTAPRKLGLAREEALRLSASFADMFQQIGYGADAATGASKQVLQMAADLGSFKNLETADVLERLSGAFRGEYDSLQLLIPNISAARVEHEAMAATGKKSAESLTAQEKAAATLAIVQKDGARAMGDFARTADGAANAEKTALAQSKDLAAQLGQALLPAWIALVTFGRDKAIPFLSAAVDHLGDVAHAAKPAADGLGDVVGAFRNLPPEAQAATASLVAFLALRGRLEDFGNGLKTRIGAGADATGSALDHMRLQMMYASDQAGSGAGRITGYAKAIGTAAGQGLRGAATGLLSVLGGPWGVAFAAAAAAVTFWVKKQQDAKKFTDDLKTSLDQQSGAVTENTRVKVAQKLQEEGLLERSRDLGVSMETVTLAATGNADAMKALRDRQRELASEAEGAARGGRAVGEALLAGSGGADAFAGSAGSATDVLKAQQAQLTDLIHFLQPYNTALTDERTKLQEVNKAAGVTTDSTKDLGTETGKTADDLKDAADAAKKAAQAVLDLHDAQLKASGAQIDYQDALAGVQERLQKRKELEAELAKSGGKSDRTKELQADLAKETNAKKRATLQKQLAKSEAKDAKNATEDQAAIRKELADYALTLDVTTEAGRRNKSALNDQADAAKGQAKAMLEAGASVQSVRTFMEGAQGTFVDNATRFGLSEKAALGMAKQFGLTTTEVDKISEAVDGVPVSKTILIELEDKYAISRLMALQGRINALTGKTVSVVVDEVHNTRLVNSGRLASGGRGTAGGLTVDDGGGDSHAPTGQMHYDSQGRLVRVPQANGGFHPARMYGPGDGVQYMFNEPETGGETFIPHALAKRPGALKVLGATADMFGLSVQPKSETRINRTSVLHTGPIYTDSAAAYADELRTAALLEH